MDDLSTPPARGEEPCVEPWITGSGEDAGFLPNSDAGIFTSNEGPFYSSIKCLDYFKIVLILLVMS